MRTEPPYIAVASICSNTIHTFAVHTLCVSILVTTLVNISAAIFTYINILSEYEFEFEQGRNLA